MRVFLAIAFVFGLTSALSAQQPLQSVLGVVRDSSGTGLGGADVVVGPRRATTGPSGSFRVDSLRPGQYSITVRLVGFSPIRSRVAVVASEPTEVEYLLTRAIPTLPTMEVTSHRTGLYGTVGDTAYHAAPGARVIVAGQQGGEMRTDSTGHFAFPDLRGGKYMVRVTFPGYAERRFVVELKKGEGKELAVLLVPYRELPSRADDIAIDELGKRLATGLERDRMTVPQMERYESMPLCDVPRIRAEIGRGDITIFFSLNGVTAETTDVDRICAWRADEVELVEFGSDPCRDVSGTIPQMLGIWCQGRARNVPTSISPRSGGIGGGGRIRGQGASLPYVIVWEKR